MSIVTSRHQPSALLKATMRTGFFVLARQQVEDQRLAISGVLRGGQMKKLLFFTIVPAWLCSSTTLAGSLSQPDKDYVVLGLGAVRVITECLDYRGIPDAIRKLADQIGVDPAVVSAVGQVVRMASGRDYDGSLLIPEVTQLMNDTDDWLNRELNEDRTRFCKRWGDALSEKGLIQRKK